MAQRNAFAYFVRLRSQLRKGARAGTCMFIMMNYWCGGRAVTDELRVRDTGRVGA